MVTYKSTVTKQYMHLNPFNLLTEHVYHFQNICPRVNMKLPETSLMSFMLRATHSMFNVGLICLKEKS